MHRRIKLFFKPVLGWFTTFSFVLHFSRFSVNLFNTVWASFPSYFFSWELRYHLRISWSFRLSIELLLWCVVILHNITSNVPHLNKMIEVMIKSWKMEFSSDTAGEAGDVCWRPIFRVGSLIIVSSSFFLCYHSVRIRGRWREVWIW